MKKWIRKKGMLLHFTLFREVKTVRGQRVNKISINEAAEKKKKRKKQIIRGGDILVRCFTDVTTISLFDESQLRKSFDLRNRSLDCRATKKNSRLENHMEFIHKLSIWASLVAVVETHRFIAMCAIESFLVSFTCSKGSLSQSLPETATISPERLSSHSKFGLIESADVPLLK
jgi:hypothetical protein